MRPKNREYYYVVMKKDGSDNIDFYPKRNTLPDIICDAESGTIMVPWHMPLTPGKFVSDPSFKLYGPFKRSHRIFLQRQDGPNDTYERDFGRLKMPKDQLEYFKKVVRFFHSGGEKFLGFSLRKLPPEKHKTKLITTVTPTAANLVTTPARKPILPWPPTGNVTDAPQSTPFPSNRRQNPVASIAATFSNEPGPDGNELTLDQKIRRAILMGRTLRRHGLT